jgi:dihydroorotate dehydrogenase electron transfer subunit
MLNDKKTGPRERVAKIRSIKQITTGTREITLHGHDLKLSPLPGQFAHVSVPGSFLRRPISVAGFDEAAGLVRLILRRVGRGTKTLSELPAGSELNVLLPLGNPFPIDKISEAAGRGGGIWIAAGGIGLAPMLLLAQWGRDRGVIMDSFAGFTDDADVFGIDELESCGKCHLSVGGLVTDLIVKELNTKKPDLILACGPEPMLAALREICGKRYIKTFASLEEHMGCGIGACLVCNCGINSGDGFGYRRVCKDGPVFDLSEVAFE